MVPFSVDVVTMMVSHFNTRKSVNYFSIADCTPGSGGNNHAVDNYEVTRCPLAVKLGTITADGAGGELKRWNYGNIQRKTDAYLDQNNRKTER